MTETLSREFLGVTETIFLFFFIIIFFGLGIVHCLFSCTLLVLNFADL